MFKTKRKLLSAVLALALVLALSVTALAAWPSFQNDNTNNGVITPGTPPPIATTTKSRPITLPNTSAWIGVDAPPVINGGYAYTLHNGGTQGALLEKTDLANPAPTTTPYIVLDATAQNVQQLSTPYYDTGSNIIYTAVSTTSTAASVSISLNVPAGGTGSAMGKITLAAAVNTINVQTDITTSADARYSITLSSATQVYNLVPYTSTGTYGSTYYTYNGVEIPADAYSITLNVSAGTAAVTATSITLGRYDWNLFSVNTTQDPPTKISLVSGEGQANTPISYDGSGNIYWGVWGGTHTYYQYNTSTQALAQFKPTVTGTASGFDDFYNTGAAIIAPTGSTQYVVFGSDSGTVYIRPTGSTFATATGNSFQIPSAAGMIRSSVAAKGSYVYFTSRIADSTTSTYTGRLYRADASSIIPGQTPSYTYVPLSYASTSTPVISDNNYVYVGTYNGFTSGTVEAILYSNIAPSATMVPIYPESGTGAPVQSSPIVWSDATDDYVYFTTNSSSGAGYCYYIDTTASPLSASEEWTAPNTSGNNYSLQGMAYSDIGGYVVWGDDGNNLYIAP